MQFAMTQGSTGSARESTSTVSSVDSPQLAKSTGVFEAKVTFITRPGHHAGQHGRETRPCLSADTAEHLQPLEFIESVDCGHIPLESAKIRSFEEHDFALFVRMIFYVKYFDDNTF